MTELAVLIPTRGRPDNIRKVISAWDFTNAWHDADMILIVDGDDPEIDGYRALFEKTRHPDTDDPLFSLQVMPFWQPMVHKLNRIAEAAALSRKYWALGFAGDDHLPQTIGWAKRYLTVLHDLQTGMVYGDDGYQGIKLSTEWAITADVVCALGRMVPAPVEHMYCDNSMIDLFDTAGAIRHLPEVRIEHMHPIVGKAETDAQYQRVNHRDQFKKDRGDYESWQRSAMAADVAAVKALRPGLPEFRLEKPTTRRRNPGSVPRQINLRPRGKTVTRLPVPKELRKVKGATPDEIGLTLADFAIRVPADQAIVEIGVYQGRTALLMAWGAQQGNGAHVWGIDAWGSDGNTYGPPFTESESWARYNVQATGHSQHVTLIKSFSQTVSDNWEKYGTQPVGLLFIDGDHSKEGARRDVLAWSEHLAPGATIALDDYDHPDYPGVREAIEELVAEGVLDPVEVFHDRLAVTKLTAELDDMGPISGATKKHAAITSEGISPSPYPAVSGQVAVGPDAVDELFDSPVNTESGPPEGWVQAADGSWSDPDAQVSNMAVREGELGGVAAGTPIEDLNLGQLRALAKHRNIVLGKRKDLKADILQALRDGA